MKFKTHAAHIAQIKKAIEAYGPVYFHGDGNIYDLDAEGDKNRLGMHPSDLRVKFPTKCDDLVTFRVLFNKVGDVPDTVEGINELLLRSKDNLQSDVKERANIVKTIQVDAPKPVPVIDAEKERLKAQLEAVTAELEKLKTSPAPETQQAMPVRNPQTKKINKPGLRLA